MEGTERNQMAKSVAASRVNNSAISPRCDGDCITLLTNPPLYGHAHEDITSM